MPAEAYRNQPPGPGVYLATASISLLGSSGSEGGVPLLEDMAVQARIDSGGCTLLGLPRLRHDLYEPERELRCSLMLQGLISQGVVNLGV